MNGRTIFDKLWQTHRVQRLSDRTDLLYIDRIFLHERTGSIALRSLAQSGHVVRRPNSVFATMDHIVDTAPGREGRARIPNGEDFILATRDAAIAAGITLFDIGDPRQGIVHVVSAESGIALPGLTLVCPDSHTSTIGGLGALAWGIGSTEAEHALATATLAVRRPPQMRVSFDGLLHKGVTAKDLILYLIGRYSASGGLGHALEFAGPTVGRMPVEGRFTLCNMAVEFGAWTGIVAPDEVTIDYVEGRPFAPKGATLDAAVADWRKLASDDNATFDREIVVDAGCVGPQITWGTSPQQVVSLGDAVPSPENAPDRHSQEAMERALQYMGLCAGQKLRTLPIAGAFIGSCTNARLSDLRDAASVLDGRKVAPGVQAICVPGSSAVKRAAEMEGLDKIFRRAGFEWHQSGCALCFYAGGSGFKSGDRIVSSTNRNFEGRQGPGTRTHLASPSTVAASAVLGRIGDAGELA